MEDTIDLMLRQWRRLRPDLDPTAMRTSGRLLRLGRLLERRTEVVLQRFGIGLWQFDVLATLRRHDEPLSPGQLVRATMLTSGAMTHRLDRLEAAGYIERRPDPNDRRGQCVVLSGAGLELIDRAIGARFEEAARIEGVFSKADAAHLSKLLTKLEKSLKTLDEP